MRVQIAEQLKEIIFKYGVSVCDEPKRLESLLKDLCPNSSRENFILLIVVRQGIIPELLETKKNYQIKSARLKNKLINKYGIESELANWAIDAWAYALGVIDEINEADKEESNDKKRKNLKKSNENTEKENRADKDFDKSKQTSLRFQYNNCVLELKEWFVELIDRYQINQLKELEKEREDLKPLSISDSFKVIKFKTNRRKPEMGWFPIDGFEILENEKLKSEIENMILEKKKNSNKKKQKKEKKLNNAEAKKILKEFKKGYNFFEQKDYKKALLYFENAAKQGQVDAQYYLGLMYKEKLGVEWRSYPKAVKWYRKSAEQGHASAQNELGYMYHYGLGITKDHRKAKYWYQKAIRQNNDKARKNLMTLEKNKNSNKKKQSDKKRGFKSWIFIIAILSVIIIYGFMIFGNGDVYEYEVIFQDHSGVIETQTVEAENSAGTPQEPNREGYKFEGWDSDLSNITEDKIIEAIFVKEENEVVFNEVVFKDHNGVIETQEVELGENATAPIEPSREGYKFEGWDSDFSNITEDKIIEAIFVKEENEVVFNEVIFKDHNGVIETQEVELGENATAPTEPSREGYEFEGWDSEFSNITEDITVEAIFINENIARVANEDMVLVETGTTASDNGSLSIENKFYIDKYHVTQAEFEEVMGFNPSFFNAEDDPDLTGDTANRPVENVTWYDAIMYANNLSEAEGLEKYYNIRDIQYSNVNWRNSQNIISAKVTKNEGANGYRLPTSKEWEYAARGGKDGEATVYAGSNDLDEIAWYEANSYVANSDIIWSIDGGTMPVGEKEPNELNIYDMSGNVYDWTNTTNDDGSYQISRGGSFYYSANACEVVSSKKYYPYDNQIYMGFRLIIKL